MKSFYFRGPYADEQVRALLNGTKTRMSIPMKVQPKEFPCFWPHDNITPSGAWIGNTWHWASEKHFKLGVASHAPYQVGDRLWLKEKYRKWFPLNSDIQPKDQYWHVRYAADGLEVVSKTVWDEMDYSAAPEDSNAHIESKSYLSPITMPQWASRATIEIVSVYAQRVQDTTEEESKKEGSYLKKCNCQIMHSKPKNVIDAMFQQTWCHKHGYEFKHIYKSTYGSESYERNDWLWVAELKLVK